MPFWDKMFAAGGRLERFSPRIGARVKLMAAMRTSEPELRFVQAFARRDRVSIDIGANWGMYSAMLQPVSKQVVAFEPNPVMATGLRQAWPGLRVKACALGAQSGTATLRVPTMAGGIASTGFGTLSPTGFQAEGFIGEIAFTVPVRRLDDLHLGPIGFIKIDVEGFEEAVLSGAARTIERDRPNMMIELNAEPATMVERFIAKGYSAFFVRDGALRPFSEWSPDLRGWHGGPHNNFLFRADPDAH